MTTNSMQINHVGTSNYKNDINNKNDKHNPELEIMIKLPKQNVKRPNKDTTCGIGFLKGACLQKFANKKAYVLLYGILGSMLSASSAYFNGTITTLEKRFKIPSRTTGIITVGNDLSQLLVSVCLSYYTGKRHRPRWMALGLYTVVLFCILSALPHLLYGPGEDALLLTSEFGSLLFLNNTNTLRREMKKTLCHNYNLTEPICETEGVNYAPQVILFVAQFISGIGGHLYHTLGVSYMDDNAKKSKTPALISFCFFLKLLGFPVGHVLASICLKLYISPNLTPTIDNSDPRWLGAWWLGWIILSICIFILGSLLALFPKTLPRAAARREYKAQISSSSVQSSETPASFNDMIVTFKRIISNPTIMMNNFASVFYFLGYMPYFIFLPKYIETQYKQSASASSLITGTVGLVFSAAGVLVSGIVISRFKPRARYLAGWNVIVGAISVLGITSYAFLGCSDSFNKSPILSNGELNPTSLCNVNCNCDYVKYNPVCSSDGKTSFISACHAGCKRQETKNLTKMFFDCSCIKPIRNNLTEINESVVFSGNCPVDCFSKFYIFLAVVCILKFSGATGRAANFLITVRSVDENDKPVAMGFGLMMMSLCAFVPSPILFGIILDKACLVWGKTCSGNGNCWLYNGETLRYTMNFTAAAFVTIGTLFDSGVWYVVKDLKIFEDDIHEIELKEINNKNDTKGKENTIRKI